MISNDLWDFRDSLLRSRSSNCGTVGIRARYGHFWNAGVAVCVDSRDELHHIVDGNTRSLPGDVGVKALAIVLDLHNLHREAYWSSLTIRTALRPNVSKKDSLTLNIGEFLMGITTIKWWWQGRDCERWSWGWGSRRWSREVWRGRRWIVEVMIRHVTDPWESVGRLLWPQVSIAFFSLVSLPFNRRDCHTEFCVV